MNTKRARYLAVAIALCMPSLMTCGIAHAAEEAEPEGGKAINIGSGEMGIEGIRLEGPPLKSDQVKSAAHAPYPRGMTCAECHKVTFDLITSATKQFTNNFPQLSNDEIWEKIEAFLPGRERFVLTTSYNGEPTATTVDMVLDKESKILFVVSEKGTEKLLHIRENPNISAVHFAGWTVAEGGKKEWRSVQIKGQAEIITEDDPRFDQSLEKYNLVRVSKQRAHLRFDLIKITPTQIYYFDTTLGQDNYSVYQLWVRS